MRPISLTLTGFKGIWSGLGRESVMIDFTGFQGLVALIGDNGRGKSTVLGNMHPYRIMPDRVKTYSPKSFSFYDECSGSGAVKDFVFAMGGDTYRSVLQIDVARRKQEAYLYRKGETEEWEPWGNTQDGKLDAYDAAVERLCGTPRMFFTSVFRCQKAPALSGYTRAEMMGIFAELINVADLKEKKETAGDVADALLRKRDGLHAERAKHEQSVKEGEEKSRELADAEKRLAAVGADIKTREAALADRDSGIRQLEIRLSLQEEAAKQQTRLAADIVAKTARLTELKTALEKTRTPYDRKRREKTAALQGLQTLAETLPALRATARQEDAKAADLSGLKADLGGVDGQLDTLTRKLSEYGAVESRKQETEKRLQKMQLDRTHAVATARKDLERAEEVAQRLLDFPCANTDLAKACDFVKDAAVDRERIPALEQALARASAENPEEAPLRAELASLSEALKGRTEVAATAESLRKRKGDLARKVAEEEAAIASLRLALKKLPEAEAAERNLPDALREIDSIEKEGKEAVERYDRQVREAGAELDILGRELEAITIDASLAATLAAEKVLRDQGAREVEALRTEEAGVRMTIGALAEAVRLSAGAVAQIEQLRSEASALDREISEWQIIEKAMEGVMTLEIDDAGPAVTAITNDILHCCYGPRFSVKIKTQDEKAGGKEMKEVFDIVVFDAERDESKSLTVMSGGEETWIEDSITRGISLFNAERGGRRYHALFTDEKDGRLTDRRRTEFMAVKRRVLELGGFECEFFISHSREVQEMADAVIDLNSLALDHPETREPEEELQETLLA